MRSSCNSNTDRKEEECLHETWLNLQHEELKELEQAAAQIKNGLKDEQELTQLIQRIINNFQDYVNNRSRLAQKDVSPFFAPNSCTPLENSALWITGCRPTSFIRLIYALCGMEVESRLTDFLQGIKNDGELSDLTGEQMSMIDELHKQTIREERDLSSKLASLQEDIVDQPLASMMKKNEAVGDGECEDRECEDAEGPLDEHSHQMANVMKEADDLRMKTLKQILSIFKPGQAVEYLAAAKKIRFCVQQWGQKRDHDHST